ncbi:tRNA-specific 2-thiouridylase MnmA [bacterium HR41]|nr:tRNA-specific 2-thiouridylase MnmA [bacterium HR41]
MLAKDARHNRLVVGGREELLARRVALAEDLVLHRDADRVGKVQLRYRQRPLPARLVRSGDRFSVELAEPAPAPAPGQTACLLDATGEFVLGAATIAGWER